MSAALVGFAVLLILILLRTPVAFAMGAVGFFGFAVLGGLTPDNFFSFNWTAPLSAAARRLTYTAREYSLSVIPLFLLMGNLVSRAGISHEIYRASYAFLGHRRGGLAMATIVACGGFAAICGSSLATAATMAKVAMPPMRRFGYADSLAAASIAAGGTLGILIPPSVILVIYALLTESGIRDLFAAGFLPGLLGVLFYLGAVRYCVWRKPAAGPRGEKSSAAERIAALRRVWPVGLLFLLVIGGIYGGVFTPTEAAGVGAAGAFVIALWLRALSAKAAFAALADAARTSAMLFSVLIGALIFSAFINRSGMAGEIVEFINAAGLSPFAVILAILAIYIVLGMVFESLSMLLLTVPVFFPLIASLGFDPVWFGIVVVVVTEISLITPPVGLNVFVLAGALPGLGSAVIFRGITPFWIADIFRLAIIVFFPAVALALPQWLYG
jgi:tripartite ATP-independent transporter DctM subunit